MGHKHDEHCEHPPAPPQEIHQVPIAGVGPILIPLLLIAAWVVVSRRKGK